MMKYNSIVFNDTANAPGVCVSVYLQGCPHHCDGCFNPETWDFEGGKEFSYETLESILTGLTANGINRSLCILGGEPLCEDNIFLTYLILDTVKRRLPGTKIYIWTGYTIEQLRNRADSKIRSILSGNYADVLIDGPYIKELRDITLPMRGSSNQRVLDLHSEKNLV